MAEKKTKKVTVYISEELHKPARVKIAELDTSFQAVLIQMLKEWTFGERTVTVPEAPKGGAPVASADLPQTDEERQYVRWLVGILRGPDGDIPQAIRLMLQAEGVQLDRRKSTAQKRRTG